MRIPVIPTVFVALACAAMVALGLWQWQRRDDKAALIALYQANSRETAEIGFPELAPVPDAALFRRSRAMCLEPVAWQVTGGRDAKGRSGFRYIAQCRTGAEGPGLLADMGVSRQPDAKPQWSGGEVAGVITTEPETRSIISRWFGDTAPLRPMIVATTPIPELTASQPPSTDDVPNNHFAYAIQWFLFAGIAALIYGIALRRRLAK
jgi:surfeit locus 1 family protein